jgi:hypothetical protein
LILAALAGTGTEQPTGIINTGSIGGFSGSSLASAGLLDAQARDVAAANALDGSPGYVTTPAVAALLMNRPELATTGLRAFGRATCREGTVVWFQSHESLSKCRPAT